MDALTPDMPRRLPDCVRSQVRSTARTSSQWDGTSGLTIEIDRAHPRPVVSVHGDLDAMGEPLLAAVLDHVARTDGPQVLVDLRGVPFADSHGLRPALRCGVAIVDASPLVRRLLALLGASPLGHGPAPTRDRRSFRRRPSARLPGHR